MKRTGSILPEVKGSLLHPTNAKPGQRHSTSTPSRRASSAAPQSSISNRSSVVYDAKEALMTRLLAPEDLTTQRMTWATAVETRVRSERNAKLEVLSSVGRVEKMVGELGNQEDADLFDLLDVNEINQFLMTNSAGKVDPKNLTDLSKSRIDSFTDDMARKATSRTDVLHALNVWFAEKEDVTIVPTESSTNFSDGPSNGFVVREIEKIFNHARSRMTDLFRGLQTFKERADTLFYLVADKEWMTADTQSEFQYLRSTAKKFSHEVAVLTAKLQQSENSLESVRIQMEEHTTERRELNAKIERQKKTMEEVDQELSEARLKATDLETRNAKLQFQLDQKVGAGGKGMADVLSGSVSTELVGSAAVAKRANEIKIAKLKKVVKCLKKQLAVSEQSRMQTEDNISNLLAYEKGVLTYVPSLDYIGRLQRRAEMAEEELEEMREEEHSASTKSEMMALHQVALDRMRDEYELKMAQVLAGGASASVDFGEITKRMAERAQEAQNEREKLQMEMLDLKKQFKTLNRELRAAKSGKIDSSEKDEIKLAYGKLEFFFKLLCEVYTSEKGRDVPQQKDAGGEGDDPQKEKAESTSELKHMFLNSGCDQEFVTKFSEQLPSDISSLLTNFISTQQSLSVQSEYEYLIQKNKNENNEKTENENENEKTLKLRKESEGAKKRSSVSPDSRTRSPQHQNGQNNESFEPEYFDDQLFERVFRNVLSQTLAKFDEKEKEIAVRESSNAADKMHSLLLCKLYIWFKVFKDGLIAYLRNKSNSRNDSEELQALIARDGKLKQAKNVAAFQSLVAKKKMHHVRETMEKHEFEPTSIAYQFLERMEAHYKKMHEKWNERKQVIIEERRRNAESVVVILERMEENHVIMGSIMADASSFLQRENSSLLFGATSVPLHVRGEHIGPFTLSSSQMHNPPSYDPRPFLVRSPAAGFSGSVVNGPLGGGFTPLFVGGNSIPLPSRPMSSLSPSRSPTHVRSDTPPQNPDSHHYQHQTPPGPWSALPSPTANISFVGTSLFLGGSGKVSGVQQEDVRNQTPVNNFTSSSLRPPSTYFQGVHKGPTFSSREKTGTQQTLAKSGIVAVKPRSGSASDLFPDSTISRHSVEYDWDELSILPAPPPPQPPPITSAGRRSTPTPTLLTASGLGGGNKGPPPQSAFKSGGLKVEPRPATASTAKRRS